MRLSRGAVKIPLVALNSTISPKSGLTIPQDIKTIYSPVGCEKCNYLGYKGRTTLTEVFTLSREIRSMIEREAITSELHEKAIEEGMITMPQDGILKVIEGETTLEEVERVTEL